ncbi:MAG: hypothetical protein R3B09_30775 [Nannocystaceae bacterium]
MQLQVVLDHLHGDRRGRVGPDAVLDEGRDRDPQALGQRMKAANHNVSLVTSQAGMLGSGSLPTWAVPVLPATVIEEALGEGGAQRIWTTPISALWIRSRSA